MLHKLFMMILLLWVGISATCISSLLGIGIHTIGFWSSVIRCVATDILNEEEVKIGGEGRVVEIDEAIWRRRKYKRGRRKKQIWIFGGVERKLAGEIGTPKFFVCIVPDRSRNTLIPLIQKHIAEGTTIISDEWRAYCSLNELGYRHQTVQHKRHFVDPETKACTNTIEGLWSHMRSFFPRYGAREAHLPDYLALWIIKHRRSTTFMTLIKRIGAYLPQDDVRRGVPEADLDDEDEDLPDIDDIVGASEADSEGDVASEQSGNDVGDGMDSSEWDGD